MANSNDADIIDMFTVGVSMRKIAEHFGTTHKKISQILESKGYTSDYRKVLPEKEICDLYSEGQSLSQLGSKYKVAPGTVKRVLVKNQVSVRSWLKELDEKEIIKQYVDERQALSTIAEPYDVNESVIKNRLQANGIVLRTSGESNQKYTLNETFFKTIDTEEKAYWLGFMFADGYVKSNLRDFGITLMAADAGHISKFIEAIEYTDDVRIYGEVGQQYARCVPANRKSCMYLVEHGCVPNKTHDLDVPLGVPVNLQRHFIRGVVDGDGGLYLYARDMSVEIVGAYNLLTWIKNVSEVELSDVQVHKSIHRVRTRSKTALDFATWLYEDSTVYLDRKYDKYVEAKRKYNV